MDIVLNVVNQTNEGSTSTIKHSWVVEIKEKLNKLENIPQTELLMNKQNAIYRRPVNLRKKQDSNFLYTPYIVSVGPYHCDDESYQYTNQMKELVLLHCLKRSGKELDDYIVALIDDVKDLKDAYNLLDPKWQRDDDEFLRLMIYDGCFILEILQEAEQLDHIGYLFHKLLTEYGISRNELMDYFRHDMLLIENQLPMQLLVKLVAVQKGLSAAKVNLYKLILRFVAPSSPDIAEKLLAQDPECTYLHVLDLYRHSLLFHEPQGESTTLILLRESIESRKTNAIIFLITFPMIILYIMCWIPAAFMISLVFRTPVFLGTFFKGKSNTDIDFIIPSATELDKVGIRFNMSRSKSLKDVSFQRRTLTLPQIYVDGATQSRFLNIIAFEQLNADAENAVTSYIYFMSKLFQVADDVRLLQSRGFIFTALHNDEVVELFKSLTKDINVHDPNIFFVKKYCKMVKTLTMRFRRSDVWRQGDLWQTYLKSPLTVISVVAAFFLFVLTLIQTVFTVMTYYYRSK